MRPAFFNNNIEENLYGEKIAITMQNYSEDFEKHFWCPIVDLGKSIWGDIPLGNLGVSM